MAQAAIRRVGNSQGVLLPKAALSELGPQVGDKVTLAVEEGRIVLAPTAQSSRAGWAEAATAIMEAGDDHLVWPELSNAGDDVLRW